MARGAARARRCDSSRVGLSLARRAGRHRAPRRRTHGSSRRDADIGALDTYGLDREAVTVLLHAEVLASRRGMLGGSLSALGDSLAADLEPVIARPLFIPEEKARMTRRGGRCETDGTLLEFDPFSPRVHRCPRCGA